MKKLSLLIGGLLFSGLMMAQTGEQKGRITFEGQTTTSGTVIGKKFAPGARVRYFATENVALRGTFALANSTTTSNFFSNEIDNTGDQGKYVSKSTIWNLAIGAEYHVAGTEKISPYAAVDFVYGNQKQIVDATNASSSGYLANYSRDSETPTARLGVALMGGLDYNFSNVFYLGGEIGIQITSTTTKESKTTIVNNGVTSEDMSNEIKKGTASDLIATVRLGFRF
jgi:outer membrane protein W